MKNTTTTDPARPVPPNVQNGTYTIDSPHGHFTLKLHTVQKGDLAGKRILSMLVGSDNESDYKGVAFWDDEQHRANVWKRYRKLPNEQTYPIDGFHWEHTRWSAIEQKLEIWCDLATRGDGTELLADGSKRQGFWAGEGYTLLREGRCLICNRKLTTPESIETGIGPVCAERGVR